MRGDLLPLSDLTQHELASWRALSAVAAEPNPFFEPEYVLPLARGLSQLPDVALAVIREGDRWAACCPVSRPPSWHRIPLPSVSLWQGHALYSSLGTPLLAADDPDPAAAMLVALLLRGRGVFFAGFDWLAQDGPVYEALLRGFAANRVRVVPFEHFDRAFTIRRPRPDYLDAAMSSRHQRDLRRKWRRLGEQLGAEPVISISSDQEAVMQLMELEGRSHLAARGSVLSADPNHERFFLEMCRGFAAQNRLELLVLKAGDVTIASKSMIIADPGIFFHKIAYDETFSSFSPGIQLEVEAMKRFHERAQSQWMDSCSSPTNSMSNRLMPDRRPLVSLVAVDRTPRELVTLPAVRAVRYVRDRVIEARTPAAD